ncbi:MAG: VanW family protein [Sphingomonas sp.]
MLTALRRLARAYVPEAPRLAVAAARRRLRDRVSGDGRRLVRRCTAAAPLPHRIVEISQPIRNTAFLGGKLANIRLGVSRLDGIVIAPGEIFSFWTLIGRPSPEAGFALGRSIRGGAVGGEIGGGLCQLSGIAYELFLRAGLDVLERHAHSHDLYSEEERFTPLGLDATVVWPFRDLRLANGLDVPVIARFTVDGLTLNASLHAARAIVPKAIEIERTDHAARREVSVSRDGAPISHDHYLVAPLLS